MGVGLYGPSLGGPEASAGTGGEGVKEGGLTHCRVETPFNQGERGMTMNKAKSATKKSLVKGLSTKAGIKAGGIFVQHNRRLLRA